MKTIFGFSSVALAGATAQSIAAAANSGQIAVLNLRFRILYPFIRLFLYAAAGKSISVSHGGETKLVHRCNPPTRGRPSGTCVPAVLREHIMVSCKHEVAYARNS